MKVDGLGQQAEQPYNQAGVEQRRSRSDRLLEQVSERDQAARNEAVVDSGRMRAKGVVRLLQEEQFQGVADRRLRLNFQQELEAAAGTAGNSQPGEAQGGGGGSAAFSTQPAPALSLIPGGAEHDGSSRSTNIDDII